jgi:superfamily I DNA and RNA helicase
VISNCYPQKHQVKTILRLAFTYAVRQEGVRGMTLEVVWGNVQNEIAAQELANNLKTLNIEGTLYLGYPVMASADSSTTVQALLISLTPGLVAFDFPEPQTDYETIKQDQDSLVYAVEGNLSKHVTLRKGRRLGIIANVISFFPAKTDLPQYSEEADYLLAYPSNLGQQLSKCAPVDNIYYRNLSAAVQRVTTIKPVKKRENVKKEGSRGSVLKIIEKNIANLDQWQKKAAIETPNGPQRVRGLAGSGKTIVLALKAAYLHTEHPDWTIAVTFQTRSLQQQFTDLVERFTIEHSGDKPNPKKLKILHAWGGFASQGVYSEIAQALQMAPFDFGSAKQKYGMQNAFNGACSELLPYAKNSSVELYDAILIDEAQDLPKSFFQLIYHVTKPPKRIVWAYDELQNLNNTLMSSVSELFNGEVTIQNPPNAPQQDIILPVCYRNSPWSLTLAHALGFGIYRESGLVQLFDELGLWSEIGYQIDDGKLDSR